MKIIIVCLLTTFFLAGCGTFYSATDKGEDNSYENEFLIIEKQLTPLQVSLNITNKTDKDMEILWDKCTYRDLSGISYNIIHGGVKFTEDGDVINPPTIVQPHQTHGDFITPLEAIKNREQVHSYKTEMYATHHETVNQIYKVGEDINYRNKKELTGLIGKTYEIFLVFKVDSRELEYTLKGTITEIIDLLKD
ncbi:MAG: hypothetical protein JXJ04_19960 [Spirochaetales bacterium]|nr:hypothetical protein [Spirochaetales bacterium]